MKLSHTSVFLILAMTLSACGSHTQTNQTTSRPYLAPTIASGLPACSPAIIDDTRAFQKKGTDVMKETAEVMTAMADPSKQSEASTQLAAMSESLDTAAKNYASKHGSVACEFQENGQSFKIDPSKIAALVNQKAAVKVDAQDGVCPQSLTEDHRQLLRTTKGAATEMMSGMGPMMKKLFAGQSADAEKAAVSQSGMIVLTENQKFRSKHSGTFSCSSTGEDGKTLVLSSDEIDQNVRELQRNLSQFSLR